MFAFISRRPCRALLAAVLLSLLAGCGSFTRIETNKDPNYKGTPVRLLVMTELGAQLGQYNKTFQSSLSQKLKACALTTNYIILAGPLKDPTEIARVDAFIRAFAPDTVLSITEYNYRIKTVTDNGAVMLKWASEITYLATVNDVATKKAVWKAQIKLFISAQAQGDPGKRLADDLVGRLAKDGILKSCGS